LLAELRQYGLPLMPFREQYTCSNRKPSINFPDTRSDENCKERLSFHGPIISSHSKQTAVMKCARRYLIV